MRLELSFGADWIRDDIGPVRVYTAPGFALVPDAFFEVFPVVARAGATIEPVLLHGVGPEIEVRRSPVEHGKTVTGWPMHLHQVALHANGALREIRVLAYYEMLVLAGFVLVRVTNEQTLAHHRGDMLGLLASARPVLVDDTVAVISDLWDMTAT